MKRLVLFSVLLVGAVLAAAAPAAASSITVHVQVNTAPLIGNVSGPFSLDFTLIDGSGTLAVPNTVTIGDFNFAGGGPTGAPNLSGGALGNLSSGVTLSDNANVLNEFFQTFTPGTVMGFNVTTTTNADPGSPDAFAFAILDKNLFNLPTTGFQDSLVSFSLTPALKTPLIQTGATTAPAGVTAAAAVVPEPGTLLLLGTGIVGIVRRRRRVQ